MSAISSKQKRPYEVKETSVYHLKLNKQIVERSPETFWSNLDFIPESGNETIGLNDILKNIKKAEKEDNIKGIYLELSVLQSGIATADEIRQALETFKKSGKFIVAYGEYMDKKSYYLATVADEIYLNPAGLIEFAGLRSEVLFFKGTFEKLGIKPKVFKSGKYKSYGERYDSDKLSPQNREQINAYVSEIWMKMLENISKNRNIKTGRLNEIASTLDFIESKKLVSNGLIDNLLYKDEVSEIIKEKCGTSKKPKYISHSKMNKVEKKNDYRGYAKEKIAVIYAYGTVLTGNQGEGTISSERISQVIEKAREDSLIKAIVLRVNSGGGSSLASEIIWRELKLTKEIKPVIVSMGDIAASGGYYISVPADTILANRFTLTGSIGVIGITYNAKNFFNKKLGITNDLVKTNPYADFGNIMREMSPVEETAVNKMIGIVYDDFVNHVAEERNQPYEDIHKIAQGRIWGGEHAKRNGLIDNFGSVDDAVLIAARMAKIEKYRVVELPKLEDPFEKLLKDGSDEIKTRLIKNELGDSYIYYNELKELFKGGICQTRLPFDIQIK